MIFLKFFLFVFCTIILFLGDIAIAGFECAGLVSRMIRSHDQQHVDSYFRDLQSRIDFNRPTMFLMRGLPGSGKSTFAKRLIAHSDGVIFSTDDYFMKDDQYIFDHRDIKTAHSWNQDRAKMAMENAQSPIVIDNTHIQAWEAKPYVEYADHYGYQTVIVEPYSPDYFSPHLLAKRNSHGVPLDNILYKLEKYERNFTVDDIRQSPSL